MIEKLTEELSNQVLTATVDIEGLQVKTQEQYELAGVTIKRCVELKKRIEKWFEPIIDKFKKAKQEAENGRKTTVEKMEGYTGPLDKAINILRSRCKDYENNQERLVKEKIAQLESEKAAVEAFGDKEEIIEHNIAIATTKPEIRKTAGLGIRRTWKWKLIDENLIPREFLVIDYVKLNAHVREHEGKTNVPGIEAYYD